MRGREIETEREGAWGNRKRTNERKEEMVGEGGPWREREIEEMTEEERKRMCEGKSEK